MDELYNLEEDPSEEVNLVSEPEDVLYSLHQRLHDAYLNPPVGASRAVRQDDLPMDAKATIARIILTVALQDYESPVILWTGGKDSTLVLALQLDAADAVDRKCPPVLFIDHGQHYPETWAFVREAVEGKGLKLLIARNEALVAALKQGIESLALEDLDPENQEEALKAGLKEPRVLLSLNTVVGNHLLKTMPFNSAIRRHGLDAIITGIRWDENPARSTEVFLSRRTDPPHVRVHPILPWTEREVWQYTLQHGLPIHPLYERGYRSFDGVKDSAPTDTRPAWEQDLEETEERAGRAQDKEEIMERLRSLGYF